MFEHILMPTDGSACSEAAIAQGLELAKSLGARVTFLYALEDPVSAVYAIPETATYRADIYEDLKKAGEDALARAEAMAKSAGVFCETLLAERASPVQAIHAAETEADLVVMGTHGRRGFDRLMVGSVAEGALRRATKPYLMIRSGEEA